MNFVRVHFRAVFALCSVALAACGGGAMQSNSTTPSSGQRAVLSSTTSTFSLPPLGQGYSGSLTVGFITGRGSELRVEIAATDTTNGTTTAPPCPTIPLIQLENISSAPIVLTLDSLSLNVPCTVTGQQFGVSSFPQAPTTPTIITSQKLGDTIGTGTSIAFAPAQPPSITLPAMSTTNVAVLLDQSGAETALPAAPFSTSMLTSSATGVPTDLSFYYTSSKGASFYTTSCFDAKSTFFPSTAPHVGVPSFFCHLSAGRSSITFGNTVKFQIGAPKIDASVLGLDGPANTYLCHAAAGTSAECPAPSFTVSNSSTDYQNVIVSNVADLRSCVPVTAGTDCNSLTAPAPSTTAVKSHRDFELLVADDATYAPGVGSWDGVFRSAIATGPCSFVASGVSVGILPAGYTNAAPQGVGPAAAFDVRAAGKGTCVITMSEDPKFIIGDFTNVASPGRTFSLTIDVQ